VKPHPFSLRQLQYVIAVADARSFRRAAELCAVSQPALSKAISDLEEALGVQILERAKKGVVVTAKGGELLARMRQLVVAGDDLVEQAHRMRDPLGGTLRVAVIPTVAPYLLPTAVPLVTKALPGLRVVWIEAKTDETVARIENGDADGGIVAVESDLRGLYKEPIGKDPFYLATPTDHALARGKGPVEIDRIDGETILLLEDGHCFRDQALSACRRADATEASVRATSLSTLAQMVAGGAGLTLLPAIAIATENRARGLALRRIAGSPARTLAVAWRPHAPVAPAMRALGDVLAKALERLVAAAAAR
jgi:LysR family hydrogen peroxide-inducible transcriptional activator